MRESGERLSAATQNSRQPPRGGVAIRQRFISNPEPESVIGNQAAKPTEIPAKGWWQVLMRVKDEIKNDNLSVIAAGVALFCVAGIPALVVSLQMPKWIELTAQIVRWPLLAGVALVAMAVLYRVAPCRSSPRWAWVSPGSIICTIIWLGASAGFSWYVSSSAKYNETYGSLGGVVVLLMWLYISAFIILLGGELNSELEHQTVKDTTVGPPQPLGQRDAEMADTLPGSSGEDQGLRAG